MSFEVYVISIFISSVALVVSIAAMTYTRRRAEAADEALILSAFGKALDELGSKEARGFRRMILQRLPNYMSEHYDSDEGEDVALWVRQGNTIIPKPIKVKKMEEKKLIQAFEETAVRIDRIGFIFSTLKHSKKLRIKYLNWLCIMLCDNWNKLAPHVVIKRIERANSVQGVPPPVYFVPYFESLVYDAYDYYRKWVGENAKIFCLNSSGRIDIESG